MSAAWIADLNYGAVLWAGAMARACWQGGIGLALAWALCRAGPGLPPPARCWLWRLAYLKLLGALFWATPVDLPLLPAAPAPLAAAPATAAPDAPPLRPARRGAINSSSLPLAPAAPRPSAEAGWMLLWLLGLGGCGAGFAREWRETRRLRAACAPLDDGPLREYCEALCRRFGVRRAPRLLRTERAGSPLLVGVVRPDIVLPAPLLADCAATELALMIAHELAHVKRRDLVWSWLPTVLRGLFFFLPLVWLAEQEWRLAQEMACDEMAVGVTRVPPGEYGDILVKVAAQDSRQRRSLMTAGVLDSYQTLRRRLVAMKSIGRVSSKRLIAAGIVVATFAVVGLVPWRVTAQPSSTGNVRGRAAKTDQESLLHLERLGIALKMYTQDWDGTLPPMKSPAAAKQALYPYVRKNAQVFVDPNTDEPYLPNRAISGRVVRTVYYEPVVRRIQKHGVIVTQIVQAPRVWRSRTGGNVITELGQTVAFYEPIPARDGTRSVLFLDGQVARVSDMKWQRLKRASRIP